MLSRYIKDDLPTWQELYNFSQDVSDHPYEYISQEDQVHEAAYFKIPYKMYSLMMIANQFNKMITEDNFLEPIVDQLGLIPSANLARAVFVKFVIIDKHTDYRHVYPSKWYGIGANTPVNPYIYTLPLFEDGSNPFITDYNDRKFLRDTSRDYVLGMEIWCTDGNIYFNEFCPGQNDSINPSNIIYNILMEPIHTYFKKPVGWKDSSGNLVSDKRKITNCDSGSDPAL